MSECRQDVVPTVLIFTGLSTFAAYSTFTYHTLSSSSALDAIHILLTDT
jgi:hypothetical protein